MRNTGKKIITLVLSFAILATTVIATSGRAHAYATYTGGDWGGRDFTPANGDILSGTFTNIGHLSINAGDTIYAGSGLLAFFTNDALISGTLYGGAALSPSFNLTSSSNITLTATGILDQWKSVYLTSDTLTMNGTITMLDDGSVTVGTGSGVGGGGGGGGAGGVIIGGPHSPSVVPLPPALLLFGSGLMGLAGARRILGI